VFRFRAVIVTIGIIFNIVVIEMTIVICIARDVTRDDSVEIEVAAAEVRERRGWSGRLSGGRWDGDDWGIQEDQTFNRQVSCSNAVAVLATVLVTVDFIVSSLKTDGTVMRLCFLLGESNELWNGEDLFDGVIGVITEVENGFSHWGELGGGGAFHGGRWSVHRGEPYRWGFREGGGRLSSDLSQRRGAGE